LAAQHQAGGAGSRRERAVQLVMGVVLVAVGAWDLSQNLPQLLR
jgi:hypothetical protein